MNNRIYVGNIALGSSQASIEAMFGTCGEVRDVTMPTDRATGALRGFAFVTMGTTDAMTAALRLNGALLDGNTIKVSEAQERGSMGGRAK